MFLFDKCNIHFCIIIFNLLGIKSIERIKILLHSLMHKKFSNDNGNQLKAMPPLSNDFAALSYYIIHKWKFYYSKNSTDAKAVKSRPYNKKTTKFTLHYKRKATRIIWMHSGSSLPNSLAIRQTQSDSADGSAIDEHGHAARRQSLTFATTATTDSTIFHAFAQGGSFA